VKPNGANWREARVRLDLDSTAAAEQLGIKRRSLLNIESNQQRAMVSQRLAHRAARLYGVEYSYLVDGGTVPDEPPSKEQEQETNTGPGRDGGSGKGPGKGKTGPKRFDGAAA